MKRRPPTTQDAARARRTDAISLQILNLSTLLRRSASISYKRALGLASSEWRLLGLLGEHGALLQQNVAEALGQDKGQTSRVVSRLFDAKLVTRRRAAGGVLVDLDDKGRALVASMNVLMRRRNAKLLEGLGSDEKEVLVRALHRVTENARRLLDSAHERGDPGPQQGKSTARRNG